MIADSTLFEHFTWWLNATSFPILERTGEKTIQNQMALFLNGIKPPNTQIELEVNTRGLLSGEKKLLKREIDIFWECNGSKHAVELKFCRDPSTYNLGIFYFLQDIRFGEQLIEEGFTSFGAFFLSDVEEHFTKPKSGRPQPRNRENYELYHKFRIEKRLYGVTRIKTGKIDQQVVLNGEYAFDWCELRMGMQFTHVCIAK